MSLADTGEPDEANESPVSLAELGGGEVYLLFFNDIAHPIVEPESLAALSIGCDILGCQVAEHAMACTAFLYSGGALAWEVTHIAEYGADHLAIDGSPPEQLALIQDELRKMWEEDGADPTEDYLFEVPLSLAAAHVGYRHDQAALLDGETLSFTELVPGDSRDASMQARAQ